MQEMISWFRSIYARATALLKYLRSPLLLAIRLYWGWQFAVDGWGKLTHLAKVTEYFATLNLPAPHFTAGVVALVEFAGGILLAVGLGTRLVSLILFVNMTVAFLAAESDAFFSFFSNPDKFQGADAYNYWFAALLILILGPGSIALDRLIVPKSGAAAESRNLAS